METREGDKGVKDDPVNVYLLHFERAYKHAQHYIGVAREDVNARIERHANGTSRVKLLAAVNGAGIKWHLVRVWEGAPWKFEVILKNRGGARRCCPVCRGESEIGKVVFTDGRLLSAN